MNLAEEIALVDAHGKGLVSTKQAEEILKSHGLTHQHLDLIASHMRAGMDPHKLDAIVRGFAPPSAVRDYVVKR